jgi:hypothetical protein
LKLERVGRVLELATAAFAMQGAGRDDPLRVRFHDLDEARSTIIFFFRCDVSQDGFSGQSPRDKDDFPFRVSGDTVSLAVDFFNH